MHPVNYMLLGGIAITTLIAGLLFLRFWKSTGDRFFLFFALSFLIEGVNRILLGFTGTLNESSPIHYVIRFFAYGLILVAILDKNIPRNKNK